MNCSSSVSRIALLLACGLLVACRYETASPGPARPDQDSNLPPIDGLDAIKNPAAQTDPLQATTNNAIKFLLSKQSADGGFKSETYGSLKNGACTTSLVLYALSHLPADATHPHRAALLKACGFLHAGIEKKDTVAAPDGTLDYPTYSTAMLLLADQRLKLQLTDEQRKKLLAWLLKTQLTEAMNVQPDNIHYGGWDIEAEQGGDGAKLNGSNIVITSFALEALSSTMDADAAAAVRRAEGYIVGCQNEDGGFVFHRWRPHPGNKASWEDDAREKANAYGTPTCDGLRSLHYCGVKGENEHVAAALRWLAEHPDAKLVPGFPEKVKSAGWHEGLRFYYYLTQAKALQFLPAKEAARRAEALRDVLIQLQNTDGSFQNEKPQMFEDDKLFATSMALVALAEIKRFLP